MTVFRISPNPPYDFDAMIRRFQQNSHPLYRIEPKTLIRTIRVRGNIYLIRIASIGEVDSPELLVEVMETVKETELPFIRETVENMLSVDVDLGTYYLQLQKHQEIAFLAERLYGLRIIREADPYECLIKTIIGQQMNLSFAATLVRRLVETVSTPLLFEGAAYYPFPSPEEIASLSYEQLTQLQFSRRKAEYVINLSRKIVEGGLKFDDLDRKRNEEIMERLLPERGVGRWTVECFLLFGLGRTDLLPAADIGLRNAVKKWYGLKEQPTEADIRRMGADWTPWSSYFTFYLWESLNQPDLMPAIPDPTEP